MKSDNTVIPNILEIETAGSALTSKEIFFTFNNELAPLIKIPKLKSTKLKLYIIERLKLPKSQASAGSDDSSPSDLRRRLEDLPSPNEFIFPADRVATFGRQICHKREGFLGPHGVANRIEENDEWEEREQRAGLESTFEASRPKDARARRRARTRLKSLSCRDDETMVISQAVTAADSLSVIDKLNLPESVDKSARDDRLRLPAIATLRKQSRSSSLSEPFSSRFPHSSNGESRDMKSKTDFLNHRNFTPRDRELKTTDFPSILPPFSLSGVQPKKFGGYRPPSSVIPKNSGSNSESGSVNVTSRGYFSVRKAGNAVASSELSSSRATTVSSIDEAIRKMPITSARSDITESILPSSLPSSRLLDNDLERRAARNTRSCIEHVNPDKTKTRDEPGKINTPVKPIVNERTSYGGFVAKTSSELRQDEPEYEDARYQQQETPRATPTFLGRSFPSESTKLAATARDEQIIHSESAKAYNNFKRSSLEFKGAEDEKEGDYWCAPSKLCHDGRQQQQFEFNCPTGQFNYENGDVAEEALSSQLSEAYGSEDHSRSSCTAKRYLLRGTLSSRRPQDDTSDGRDQEIITKVPTLALNSRDISYSTSAGSRECSATLPLDPHALIKALSNVSLRREKQNEDASRKRGGFYRDADAIDTPGEASVFPTKGETWRVPNFTEPRKSLSHVSSKIPVRISSGVIAPSDNKCAERYKSESTTEAASYAVGKFIERNDAAGESIARRRSATSTLTRSQICNEMAEIKINDCAPRSLISSGLRSSKSTLYAGYARDEMQRSPENKIREENPFKFLHKAACSSDRDYAKIDDDIQSRSDRSTSRKSADTADITSATDSLGLVKYKRTKSFRIETLRNVDENVTWRTEDECASINDEDDPEGAKEVDYVSDDETSRLQDKDYKLAIGEMCGPLRTRRLNSSGIEKASRKRCAGDDLEFNDDEMSLDGNLEVAKVAQSESLARRAQEVSGSAARISSLNLNRETKRKKKSQERFPFTISEVSGALSLKDKDASDHQSSDRNLDCEKTNDRPREEAVYQLKMHPSLTRLAVSGAEDTVADILCCVAQEKRDAASKSKIKALAKIFSLKLRKAPKQPNDEAPEATKIIYENNACNADSCSGDSSTEEARKTCDDDPWVDQRAADSEAARTSSRDTPKKAESSQAVARECIRRQYDRDDLWVRDVEDPSFTGEKNSVEDNEANGSKRSPTKDRYSIFRAGSLRSNESSIPNSDDSLKEQRDMLIFDHVTAPDGKSKRNIDRKVPSNFVFQVEDAEEEPTGCLCWKLCHASRRLDIVHQ
ncbi:hypothetical protein PUN28_018606 [Cardiocondyla obscurior]|uniref:Uncharacterized protein n=1 Tax=Cardiocondyla obscurior TaxID=286306 RepID=A0AAW2EG42_9HYME